MAPMDVESVLAPIAGEDPCGPDLEYDPEYLEFDRVSKTKPEQEIGGVVLPGEEPDWGDVRRRAEKLLGRAKDLRVAVPLVRALLKTDRFEGLADGLVVVRELVARFWEGIYPKLDPSEGNDPTWRVNLLASLFDADTMLRAIREAPLAQDRRLGRVSLRDVMIAEGALTAKLPEGQAPLAAADIDAIFLNVDLEDLKRQDAAIVAATAAAKSLEAALTEKAGRGSAVSFEPLVGALKAARVPLAQALSRRGAGEEGAGEEGEAAGEGAPGGGARGDIRTREDAIRMLDRVADWFQKYEPSSPVPILLRRAKRLVAKDFMEIIKDIAPDGLNQVNVIRGPEE